MEHLYRRLESSRPRERPLGLTLGSAEVHGLRHGPHALRVPRLDLEVVGGVQRQLLDLVSQAVSHHWLDHPVVILGVNVGAVVDDVTCVRKAHSAQSHMAQTNVGDVIARCLRDATHP